MLPHPYEVAYYDESTNSECGSSTSQFEKDVDVGMMALFDRTAPESAGTIIERLTGHYDRDPAASVQAISKNILQAISRPLSPYSNLIEKQALQAYLNIMPPVGRSDVGSHYFLVTIPTLAWLYEPVRDAQTAMGILFNALQQQGSEAEFRKQDVLAAKWANKAIRKLIREGQTMPPEIPIVVSTIFWLSELCAGRNASSLGHLASGYDIATSLSSGTVKLHDPTIPRYVRNFVGTMPGPVNPQVSKLSEEEREANFEIRTQYAREIMNDALDKIKFADFLVESTTSKHKELALKILNDAEQELSTLVRAWPTTKYIGRKKDGPASYMELQDVIALHSPFIRLISHFDDFLADDEEHHLRQFEIDMGPTIDHFIWLAAYQDLELRRQVFKLWSTRKTAGSLPTRVL